MRRTLEFLVVLAAVAVVVVFLNRDTKELEPKPTAAATAAPVQTATPDADASVEFPSALVPLPDKTNVPALTKTRTVRVETSEGNFQLEIYPEAAPNAAERFIKLVEIGYYDGIPVSRVVEDFVVQFGINSKMVEWKDNNFKDDPSLFQLLPGTIAFAKAGPDTNSTQVFINLRENNRLADPNMNFTVFGRVTDGMEVVQSFRQVGDLAGGLDQVRLWEDGDAYLESLEEKPSGITRMVVVE
ncbi:MAG: peptidylprolyl isomerase [Candidatus Eremiobacteraeota bacterium]|nr:peptidylprolyl isomerase [Candidatus Eremiobacteraeota bacterium]